MDGEGGEIVVRMVLDASDLEAITAGRPGALAGGSGEAGGAGERTPNEAAGVSPAMGVPMHIKSFAPPFMSIFKPLAALEAIKAGIGALTRNSQVLNAYQAGIGKVFGAAIDMLLLPFAPILNLIMTGVMAMLAWLMKIGAFEWLKNQVEDLVKNVRGIVDWFKKLFDAFNGSWNPMKWDWGAIGGQIAAAVADAIKNPGKWLSTGAEAVGLIGASALIPGPLGAPGRWAIKGGFNAARGLLSGGTAASAAGGGSAAAGGGTGAMGTFAVGAAGFVARRFVPVYVGYKLSGWVEDRGLNPFEAILGTGGGRGTTAQAQASWESMTPAQRAVAERGEMPAGVNISTQNNTFHINGVDAARAAEMTLEELQRAAYAQQGR